MRAFFSAALPENPYLLGLLLLFVVLFGGLVVRVLLPSRQAELDRESRLPLQD